MPICQSTQRILPPLPLEDSEVQGRLLNSAKPLAATDFSEADQKRFWEGVAIRSQDDCWEWLGPKNPLGYGNFRHNGGYKRAHRVSVVLSGRNIPAGFVIDHKCRNTGCVNPNHLRVVTPRTNALENSVSITAINAQKTVCSNGHPLNEENTYIKWIPGDMAYVRQCKLCARMFDRKYKLKKRANKMATKRSLVHGIAQCTVCGWNCEDYHSAQKKASDHARKTGHVVTAEVAYHVEYGFKHLAQSDSPGAGVKGDNL